MGSVILEKKMGSRTEVATQQQIFMGTGKGNSWSKTKKVVDVGPKGRDPDEDKWMQTHL